MIMPIKSNDNRFLEVTKQNPLASGRKMLNVLFALLEFAKSVDDAFSSFNGFHHIVLSRLYLKSTPGR